MEKPFPTIPTKTLDIVADATDWPKVHCFICTNCTYKLPNGDDSTPEMAQNLRSNVKKRLKELHEKKLLRVNASGCLGLCETGISAVIYPEKTKIVNLRPEHEDELVNLLKEKCRQT